MASPTLSFFDLIYPVAVGVLLISLVPFVRVSGDGEVVLTPFGLLSIKLRVSRSWFVRSLLATLALACFGVPAFRDYSKFFPTRYNMDVFFDEAGIVESFSFYSQAEIEDIELSSTWREERPDYLHGLTLDVSSTYSMPDFFDSHESYIHSRGATSFVVEKVGWQTYRITESVGLLRHVLEVPKQSTRVFHSRFELQNSAANYIRPSLSDIYFRYSQLLRPKYKQIATTDPGGGRTLYHHTVVALIKIQFFPVPRIGNTIYLVTSDREEGKWVPIGYAIYSPMT